MSQAQVQVKAPALLPYMIDMIKTSNRFVDDYLTLVDYRFNKIVDTITFLCAWPVTEAYDLYDRIALATPESRLFITSHLCRFNKKLFYELGEQIRQSASQNDFLSPLLKYDPAVNNQSSGH